MSTASTLTPAETRNLPAPVAEITVVSHSPLMYWWPVWVVGFLFAGLTYFQNQVVQVGGFNVYIHPSKNLGVIYTMIFLMVILLTNATLRGLASATLIVALIGLTFMFAYFDWWDTLFQAFSELAIFLNLGFYVLFSSAIFLMWMLGVFFFDRLEYWTFRPGQAVHHAVFGGGSHTYDTNGMSVNKLRDDFFRHWILGLGSGDLHISLPGANSPQFLVSNVPFLNAKLTRIQELIAMKPDETPRSAPVTFGDPG